MKSPVRRVLLATVPAAVLFALGLSALPAAAQKAPTVSAAWARPTVEGQRAGGGYVTLKGGASDDRLVGATADVSASVELHMMAMEGDIMKMRRVEAIELPAGKTVKLEPGGLHVMFIGLKAPLKAGTTFPVTLKFEKGGEVTTQMTVRADAPAAQGGGHSQHKH